MYTEKLRCRIITAMQPTQAVEMLEKIITVSQFSLLQFNGLYIINK